MPLTPKQQRFVAEYLVDLNATQAAVRAGYSDRSESGASVQGTRLLANVRIAWAIAKGKARQLASAELTAARVLEELRRIAFCDPRGFVDEHGNLRKIHDLPAAQAAGLASFETIIKNAKAGDGVTDEVFKIKFCDKVKALELLAKHFKLLTEVHEIRDEDKLLAMLDAGRARNAARGRG